MTTGANDTATGVTLGDGTATAGGAATGASGSGDNTKGSGAADTSTSTGSTDAGNASLWYSGFKDDGLRDFVKGKGLSDSEALAKSYKELEVLHSSKGGTVEAPPATSKDYKFDVPADLPKEAGYNEAFADKFKDWAHKSGLTQKQAASLHDHFLNDAKSSITETGKAATEKFSKAVQGAQRDLETAWGTAGTPTFTRNIELAKRAIRLSGPGTMDALKEVGAIKDVNGQPVVMNATLIKVFAEMGKGMYAEDAVHGSPAADKNPFDEKTFDLAMAGRLVRQDPDTAETLIRAAGKEKDYASFLAGRKNKR